jgi:RNA-binding protein YhbY
MLSSSQRKALKGRAHQREPVVHIGGKALPRQGSKKWTACSRPTSSSRCVSSICEKTGADAVQQIGKLFVLYRKNDE